MSTRLITDSFKQAKSSTQREARKQIKPTVQEKLEAKDLSTSEEETTTDFTILRNFDLESEYGPCMGMTRLERWERAERFGLDPPEEVKKIIQRHLDNSDYTHCVWYDYNI